MARGVQLAKFGREDTAVTGEEQDQREAALLHALTNPMPRELSRAVADVIEPQTLNAGVDHGEVMSCIDVAYPLIRDFLRDHPEA